MGTSPYIGEISMFAGNFEPDGWAFCDGQLLPISQNQALFAILGTIYGGDGRTSFGLPDLRGRVPMHAGSGPALTPRQLGSKGGTEENKLTAAQLPPVGGHSHTFAIDQELSGSVQASLPTGSLPNTDGNVIASFPPGFTAYAPAPPNVSMADNTVKVALKVNGNTSTVPNHGGGQAVNNMPPYGTINYIIALRGTFPPRS